MIKTVAYSLRTDGRTDGRTDKSLKTEGPMILSIAIFYFKTVIIGGPKKKHLSVTTEYIRSLFIFLGVYYQTLRLGIRQTKVKISQLIFQN